METLLIGLLAAMVVGMQVYLFVQTRRKITAFGTLVPEITHFRIDRLMLLAEDLRQRSTDELFRNAESLTMAYQSALHASRTHNAPLPAGVEIPLLHLSKNAENPVISIIRDSVNTYLIRNKGSVADFNLLHDIVDRNLDAQEEDISLTLPLPLYLGLMGTMIGIVLGLFFMPPVNSDAFLQGEGVNNLISGVKIAMIASFCGLLCTVLNSWTYRQAKARLEAAKNRFYSFLQTELLPMLSESLNAGLFTTLNQTVQRFSQSFAENVQSLSGMVEKNHASLMAQQKVLETVQQVDLSRVAGFNIQILRQLDGSLDSLEKFGHYLGQLNGLVENGRLIAERTEHVEQLSTQIATLIEKANGLFQFLSMHMKELGEHGNAFNRKVGDYDNVLSESLQTLNRNIHDQLRAIEEVKLREIHATDDYFERNRDRLSKLDYLENMYQGTARYQAADLNRQEQIEKQMKLLVEQQQQVVQLLDRLLLRNEQGWLGRLTSSRRR